ncbi:MAG: ribosome-associated translation inhibitor RaiA [Planctomycetota bacterium]
MQITIVGRHTTPVDEEIKEYINKKIAHLPNLSIGIEKCEIILDSEKKNRLVEIILSIRKGATLIAHERKEDIHAAIDIAISKLERQLNKYKSRRSRRRHHATPLKMIHEEEKEDEEIKSSGELDY